MRTSLPAIPGFSAAAAGADRRERTAVSELNIAGLVPLSTVDWPDKLAAVVFLQGCPWRCPYCHNRQILDPRQVGAVSWSEVVELLDCRVGLLDAVVFSGGEALMQASSGALPAALRHVRERGFLTGLHAGGAYPRALAQILDAGLVDWVGLDIKALPEDYPRATGRAGAERAEESLAALLAHPEVEHEVRLTLWPGLAAPDRLLDYALLVATWVVDQGVRQFALQRYRRPLADPCALPEPGWDDEEARRRLGALGFDKVTVR